MTYSRRLEPNSPEYQRVHRWVVKQFGKATVCSVDKNHKATRFDWSNKDNQYSKNISDWQQLCRACHRAYDGITDEGRLSISKANKINLLGNQNSCKPVLMVYPNGSWVKFRSSVIASEATGILRSSIANAITGWSKTAGGFNWRRIGG